MSNAAKYSAALLTLVAGALWNALAAAQESFPSKPVRMIVPVVGGSMEVLARTLAPKMAESLGQPVIVESKPGAGGNIAAEFVVKSAPDGYTLLLAFTPLAVNATLFEKLPFDPVKDLAPISLTVHAPQFLVVHPSVPATSVKEFVAYAKKRPGEMNYGSVSTGSASHLTMEMFKTAAGVDLVHVPYKGGAAASADLIAGNVQAAFFVSANVLPYVKSGRMRVLASTGRTRLASLPEVPTLVESGYFEAVSWVGLMAPAATPRPIIERYHRDVIRILKMPDVVERLGGLDMVVVTSTPEEFSQLLRSEILRWGDVIKRTGARAN